MAADFLCAYHKLQSPTPSDRPAVNNADNAAMAAAKSARKMSTSELDRLLGKGWHQSNEKAKFFRDLKPQLDKLGIRNPDLYLSRQGEIILRDVRDATKYLNTGIKL